MPKDNILTLRDADQARTDFALIEGNLEFIAGQLASGKSAFGALLPMDRRRHGED